MDNNIEKMKDIVKLSIPSKGEYVSVVRLTASAIASKMNFNIEEVDDIKVAIAEACTNALEYGLKDKNKNLDIEFLIFEDRLCINVKDTDDDIEDISLEKVENVRLENIKERELGIFIIQSLMDKVEFISNEGMSSEIRMVKEIKGDME